MASRELIHELPGGKYRPATQEEIVEAQRIEQLRLRLQTTISDAQVSLTAITNGCAHVVTFDEPGFPYNLRHCVACGHTELI